MVFLSDIQRRITGQIHISEPLATYTSFGVGGPADYCVVPASQADLVHAGNLLVSDDGYRGAALMLEPGLTHLSCERITDARRGGLIRAEAGVRLGAFVEYCVNRSLRGADVLALIEIIQHKVIKEFHVLLELKVKLIGFEPQILQKVA